MIHAKNKNNPSEKKMVKAISNLFRREGYNNQRTESQFCEKFIDFICWDKNAIKVIAVEAKVKSPAKAFKQASMYKYVADYVYVAVLKNGRNERAIELATATGIGLIFVRRDILDRYCAKIKLVPNESNYKDESLTKYILD